MLTVQSTECVDSTEPSFTTGRTNTGQQDTGRERAGPRSFDLGAKKITMHRWRAKLKYSLQWPQS